MVYRRQKVYRAREAMTTSDGTDVQIVTDWEGPMAHLAPDDSELVATLSEEQARKLRDSLNEVVE